MPNRRAAEERKVRAPQRYANTTSAVPGLENEMRYQMKERPTQAPWGAGARVRHEKFRSVPTRRPR